MSCSNTSNLSLFIRSHHSEGLVANNDLRKFDLNERVRFDSADNLSGEEEIVKSYVQELRKKYFGSQDISSYQVNARSIIDSSISLPGDNDFIVDDVTMIGSDGEEHVTRLCSVKSSWPS